MPSQVAPGTKYLPKYDEFGNVKQIKMYDDYGREIGWVDYTNHGYGDINSPHYHTTPHWHEKIYNAQYIVAYVPNYQKIAYRNTPEIDYSYLSCAGYPAGRGYPVVQSVEDVMLYDEFIIEIDMKNLESTKCYKYNVISKSLYRGGLIRVFDNNSSEYGIGQFYVATLESGEKIILFLDDTALDLPKKGKVRLPIGESVRVKKNSVFNYIQDEFGLKDENSSWYVDMAGDWRSGEQAEKMEEIKGNLYLGTMVVMIALQVIVHIIYINIKKKSQESSGKTHTDNVEEAICYLVELTAIGSDEVSVIKTYRDMTGLGIKEARDKVVAVPCILLETIWQEEAQLYKETLEGCGATIKISESPREMNFIKS